MTARSLVLFDEMGAGTDPAERAALAMALLDNLLEMKVRCVATTHYSELKAFAYNREGVENGSVEFDIDTLRPTFRLMIGIPGRSNAFEISKRLGLPETLIDYAKGIVGSDQLAVEDLISNLEENHRLSQEARFQAERMRFEIESLKAEIEKNREEAKERSRELTDTAAKARSGFRSILGSVGQLSEIDSSQLPGSVIDILTLNIGDTVWLRRYECEATIIGAINSKGELPVQAGIMKMNVPIEEVGQVNRQAKRSRISEAASRLGAEDTETRELVKSKGEVQRLELDLRGKNLDDALEEVAKFLDDSYLGNYPKVRIIHGRGTGVLRKGVREYLRKHQSVKSYEFAPFNEGGDGVTVVELK
jgi:DNA mismatch repair protein MutS2